MSKKEVNGLVTQIFGEPPSAKIGRTVKWITEDLLFFKLFSVSYSTKTNPEIICTVGVCAKHLHPAEEQDINLSNFEFNCQVVCARKGWRSRKTSWEKAIASPLH